MKTKLLFFSILLLLVYTPVKIVFAGFVEVDLIIKDHKFEPEILELPAGEKIRITLHNKDNTIEEFESIEVF